MSKNHLHLILGHLWLVGYLVTNNERWGMLIVALVCFYMAAREAK